MFKGLVVWIAVIYCVHLGDEIKVLYVQSYGYRFDFEGNQDENKIKITFSEFVKVYDIDGFFRFGWKTGAT